MTNGVVHFEIVADDPEKLVGFYSGLFDWKIQKMPMDGTPYWMIQTMPSDDRGMPTQTGGINGGLTAKMAPDQRPVNYVYVDSVSDHVLKAQKLGATVLMDKTAIPGMGYFAQLTDPQGNYFGLFQGDPTAS
jgi:predicted enzyme related to lactoylglutathione lyase